MVKTLFTYSYLYIIVVIVAICIQLYFSTSVMSNGIKIYKRVKAVRVSLWIILTGAICYLFFKWTGDKLFSTEIFFGPEYRLLSIVVLIFALFASIGLQVSNVTAFLSKGVTVYKTVKAVRIFLWLMITGILCFLFFRWTGDRIISIILLITPEYKYLTIATIIAFLVFLYVKQKNVYEQLDVFGSVALICWLWLFVIIASAHFIFHYQLIGKGIRLFTYVVDVIPGYYKIIPYIILFSWIINGYVLVHITFRRTKKIITEYLDKKIRESYQEKIIELTYSETYDNELPAKEQEYFLRVKRLFFTRKIFTDELLRMHEMVYGKLHERIHSFFDLLLLPEDARNYLHNRLWYYKIKGLRIYSQLSDKSEIPYIQKLIASNNNVLRSEAQLAMARLTEDENPLSYLKDLQKRLTIWEQLNLMHYFINFQKPVGDLSALLESKNNSVVAFGLHCIRQFNRFEYRDQTIALTRHPDVDVQDAAFRALTLHGDPEVTEYIISRYDNTSALSNRLSIIKALGVIGDAASIPFLEQQARLTVEDEICIELFISLIRIDAQEASDFAGSDNSGSLLRIYNHVIDLT